MNLRIAAALAFVVSGCASTQDVMDSPAQETYKTATKPDDVAFCLATKNSTTPLRRGDGSQVILIKNGYGAVGTAFTVIPDGTGSIVEIRKPISVSMGIRWKQCVGITQE